MTDRPRRAEEPSPTAWTPTQSGAAQVGFKCNRQVYVEHTCSYLMEVVAWRPDSVSRSACNTGFWLPANTWRYVRASTAVPYGASRYTRGSARISSWSLALNVNSPGAYIY